MDERVIRSAEKACERCKEQFHFIEDKKNFLLETFECIEDLISEMQSESLNVDLGEEINVSEIVDDLSVTVGQIKDEMRRDINTLFLKKKDNLDWFTITFFGITNAGKSTLIEAIVGGKGGKTIGEGRHNTTKEVTVATQGINMPHIRILDTPGFEGGKDFEILAEEEVERTDLVVFVSSQKAPEVEEILKVTEWVKNHNLPLIMVLNQRSQRIDVKNIGDLKPTNDACVLTNKILKEDLNLTNFRVIPIHAQAAFLSRCNNISNTRQDLIKQKNALTSLFENNSIDMCEYSNFEMLLKEINRIIIDEGEIIKLKNLFDSLSIFLDNSQRKLIKNKASFDKTKRFLGEKNTLLKRDFGSRQDLGQIGKILYDILINKIDVEDLRQKGLNLIDEAFKARKKSNDIKQKLEALIEDFNTNLRDNILPTLNEDIKEILLAKLKSFENELNIEVNSFINISDISKLINNVIENYCKSRIPNYIQLAAETILTIAEAVVFIVFDLFGFIVTGIRSLFRKIFGSAAEKQRITEAKYNEKRIEARSTYNNKVDSLKEELTYKLWNGYFDKKILKRQNGLKSIIFDIRKNIVKPMNSLYFVCKKGSAILNDTYQNMELLKEEINAKLFELIITKMISEGSAGIELIKVIRKPGKYSHIFCNEKDFKTIFSIRDRLGMITRDGIINVYIWDDSKERMIHQLFNLYANGQYVFEEVIEKSITMPCIVIRYKTNQGNIMPNTFKHLVEEIYNKKVELEEVV